MELYTVKEAAEMTKMSIGWWRQRIFHKDVRFLKVGSRVLIPKSTIDTILSNSIVEPRSNSAFGELKEILDEGGISLGHSVGAERDDG